MSTYNTTVPFLLESGQYIENLSIEYTIEGKLNANKNNVIWVFHALTGNAEPLVWWEGLFQEKDFKALDDYCVICANVLGSCYGTTGPNTPLRNKRPLLDEFPFITIRDMVNVHKLLRQELGITEIYLGIGASLGGQQLLEWSIDEPDLFLNTILIATNARHSAYGIAFNESQRLAIYNDASYGKGNLHGGRQGLIVARSIALLSYRTYEAYNQTQTNPGDYRQDNFLASSYQSYQGQKLADRFSAYSYVTLSKAMDSHNVGRGRRGIQNALQKVKANTLIIGITGDVLFPVSEQQVLAEGIEGAEFTTISSVFGHDGFLIETEQLSKRIVDFLFNNFKSYKPTLFKLNYN